MKYFPFENIVYRSELSPEEVLRKLQENLEPQKRFRRTKIFGANDHKYYEGNLTGNSFQMSKVITWSNSFPPPMINGIINADTEGTKINVQMKLPVPLLLFLILWCIGVGFAFMVTIGMSISGLSSRPVFIIPLLMLIGGYGVVTWGFKYESNLAKKHLAELFKADIESE